MLESFIQLLAENKLLLCILVAIFSLCIGSFLNVVIYRLPLILNQEWRRECEEFLNIEPKTKSTPITLSSPASSCTSCNNKIRWYQNIPVVSWIVLNGKCGYCKSPIGLLYPLIEIATAILSMVVAWQYGWSLQTLFGLIFIWILIPLAVIDFKEQILPDRLVFTLIGLGLLISTKSIFINPVDSIYGTIVGFLSLWIVFKLFQLITGKEGMGYGDFKILAAFGAWMGEESLLSIIIISSVFASIVGIILLKINNESKPFGYGPYLIMAAIFTFIFGPII